ncbi:MAG: hypothetical protein ACMUEL_08295 [Flavobacteriales bacterium Tduv]
MILAVHRIAANEHHSRGLKLLISKLGYKPGEVYENKGYQVLDNVFYFHSQGIKDAYTEKSL